MHLQDAIESAVGSEDLNRSAKDGSRIAYRETTVAPYYELEGQFELPRSLARATDRSEVFALGIDHDHLCGAVVQDMEVPRTVKAHRPSPGELCPVGRGDPAGAVDLGEVRGQWAILGDGRRGCGDACEHRGLDGQWPRMLRVSVHP